LVNGPLRAGRVVALFDAVSALAERFVEGVPMERFQRKTGELAKGEFFYIILILC
jgi:peroxisomal 3,2-trans-enoyl-CoA isomerase